MLDELGKMELASNRFRKAVTEVFGRDVAVVATVHAHRHPFTDELKQRPAVQVVHVTPKNRDPLPEDLAAQLASR